MWKLIPGFNRSGPKKCVRYVGAKVHGKVVGNESTTPNSWKYDHGFSRKARIDSPHSEHGGINQIQVFPGYFGGLEIRLGASWFYQKLKIYNKFAGTARLFLGAKRMHLYRKNRSSYGITYEKMKSAAKKFQELYTTVGFSSRTFGLRGRKCGLDVTRIERTFVYPADIADIDENYDDSELTIRQLLSWYREESLTGSMNNGKSLWQDYFGGLSNLGALQLENFKIFSLWVDIDVYAERVRTELNSFMRKYDEQSLKKFIFYDEARNLANMYELFGYAFPGTRFAPAMANVDYMDKYEYWFLRCLNMFDRRHIEYEGKERPEQSFYRDKFHNLPLGLESEDEWPDCIHEDEIAISEIDEMLSGSEEENEESQVRSFEIMII